MLLCCCDSKLGIYDSKLGFRNSKFGFRDSKLGIYDSKLGFRDSKLVTRWEVNLPGTTGYTYQKKILCFKPSDSEEDEEAAGESQLLKNTDYSSRLSPSRATTASSSTRYKSRPSGTTISDNSGSLVSPTKSLLLLDILTSACQFSTRHSPTELASKLFDWIFLWLLRHKCPAKWLPKFNYSVIVLRAFWGIYAKRAICYRNSVCPSARPSVTRVDQSKTVEVRIMPYTPYSNPIHLLFAG